MEQKEILLDEEAERLFQELGGIDRRDRNLPPDHPMYRQRIEEDEDDETSDPWRVLLIEWLHFLTSYFQDVRFSEGIKTKKDLFVQIAKSLYKLSQMPKQDGSILIRYRGVPTGVNIPVEADYVVMFGNLRMDVTTGISMVKRMGIQMSHLSPRLTKSFNLLSDYGINTLYLDIPSSFPRSSMEAKEREAGNKALEQLQVSLDILCRYNVALKTNSPIIFEKNGKEVSLPIVKNRRGNPDINLTILAGLNNLKPEAMRSLVNKVDEWMRGETDRTGKTYVSLFNAIFDIRSLREKLIKPPIEVNNIKWMVLESDQQIVSKERISIARLTTENFGNVPQKAGEAFQAVYGNDYKNINTHQLGNRIHFASNLLNSIGQGTDDSETKTLENEILVNIQERFNQLSEEIFNDLIVREGDMLHFRSGEEEKVIGKIHTKLKDIFSFYKGRTDTRRKMKEMSQQPTAFDDGDYNVIAQDFDLSVQDAKSLIRLLKECFDAEGHFIRKSFEKNIPEFIQYEKKVFDFMWHYLKETFQRRDRVAFLNSLQLLTSKMKEPKRAIRVLLTDILNNSRDVKFSDRNAFMLASLLIRKYNKELNLDIEITPEEVLRVKEGLNHDVVTAAKRMIHAVQPKIIEKIETIHNKLMEFLRSETDETELQMPIRYIFALEREAYIFLSLVGGGIARRVIRRAVEEYGNPKSKIFRLKKSQNHLGNLLQHLNVVIRAMGRVGYSDDLELLERVNWSESEFLKLTDGTPHQDKVRRVMRGIETSKTNIIKYSWKDTGDTGKFQVM